MRPIKWHLFYLLIRQKKNYAKKYYEGFSQKTRVSDIKESKICRTNHLWHL